MLTKEERDYLAKISHETNWGGVMRPLGFYMYTPKVKQPHTLEMAHHCLDRVEPCPNKYSHQLPFAV